MTLKDHAGKYLKQINTTGFGEGYSLPAPGNTDRASGLLPVRFIRLRSIHETTKKGGNQGEKLRGEGPLYI